MYITTFRACLLNELNYTREFCEDKVIRVSQRIVKISFIRINHERTQQEVHLLEFFILSAAAYEIIRIITILFDVVIFTANFHMKKHTI